MIGFSSLKLIFDAFIFHGGDFMDLVMRVRFLEVLIASKSILFVGQLTKYFMNNRLRRRNSFFISFFQEKIILSRLPAGIVIFSSSSSPLLHQIYFSLSM